MALINTLNGEVDESKLIKREGSIDNDNEKTQTVEYCLIGCEGEAHKTNVPDSESHFCRWHVHRSVHVTLKKPVALEGVAGSFL